MALVGVLAITAMAMFLAYLMFAGMAIGFLGFDETNPVLGFICLVLFVAILVGWWLLVGTHITIGYS